jgi:histone acetyltransferase (RNA polymerase elongator complex component)
MTPKRRVIPVFVPHLGCPNDCVFCNQRRISGASVPASPETVRNAVSAAPDWTDDRIPVQLAFYGGSFTAIPVHEQDMLLEAASGFLGRFPNGSLRISTRPDCIDRITLERLKRAGVTTIELGAQSMDDLVLLASGRGHTARDTEQAADLVKRAGYELILQMMTGLPGDTPEKAIMTAERLVALKPDGVRIYPTVVIKDTALHDMFLAGGYKEHTVEDAVALCAEIVPLIEDAGIPVIRLGLNPTEELTGGDAVAGAYHPAFGALVYSRIFLNKARLLLKAQGNFCKATLGVHPRCVSEMTGHRKCNIEALRMEFDALIKVEGTSVQTGEIVILCIEKTC